MSRRYTLAVVLALAGGLAPGRLAAQGAPPDRPASLPAEVFLFPRETAMVIGADVRGFFASRLWAQVSAGKLPLTGVPADKAAEAAREVHEGFTKAMAEMERDAGFRADRDLDTVAVGFAVSGPEDKDPDVIALAFGRFDRTRVLSAVEASETRGGARVGRKQAGGATIQWTEKAGGKPGPAIAFVGDRVLAVGELRLVEDLLAAHAAGRRPLEANADLTRRLRATSPAGRIFMLVGETFMQAVQKGPAAPTPFPPPRTIGLSSEFDGPLELSAEMASPAQAQEAAATLTALLAGLRGPGGAARPGTASDPFGSALAELAAGITVSAEGALVRVTGAQGGIGLGTVAAIAIPSLLRARTSANEAAAIGDLRTMAAAQAAYQSANDGFYGELPCLSQPSTCLKGYTGPNYLDAALTSLEPKGGYRRAFHPGKRAATRPRSLEAYAYTAVPLEKGKTGVRSFCVDASGVLRSDPTGSDIPAPRGECPSGLAPLQ